MAQNSLRLVEDKAVDKSKALDAALSQIERAFGKGSIMRLGANEQVVEIETVPTGSLGLDIPPRGGGMPRGRLVGVFGAGKLGQDDAGAAHGGGSPEERRHLRLRRCRARARPGLCPQARRRSREPP